MAKMVDAVRRLTTVRRRYGTPAAVQLVMDRLGKWCLDLSVCHVLWLDEDCLCWPSHVTPVADVCKLSSSDIRQLAEDPHNHLSAELADRIDAGLDFCFASLTGSRVLAYEWYALKCIEPEHCAGTALSFADDTAYLFNGFTHPDHRGSRIHACLMRQALDDLAGYGVARLVSTVDWTNFSSLRGCQILGYCHLGYIVRWSGLRRSRAWYPSLPDDMNIQFGRAADLSVRQGTSNGETSASHRPNTLHAAHSG